LPFQRTISRPSIEIRQELPVDVEAVRSVHDAAFGNPGKARLVSLLREAGRAVVSLVAVIDAQVVGHILFSPVTVEHCPDGFDALGLAPVGVLPMYQRKGVGSALIMRGLEISKENGCDAVVLVCHPDYYPKFGFLRASDYGLRNEYGVDDEFMVLALSKSALDRVSGLVQVASEFGSLE
jgi:putative acetyltransferase